MYSRDSTTTYLPTSKRPASGDLYQSGDKPRQEYSANNENIHLKKLHTFLSSEYRDTPKEYNEFVRQMSNPEIAKKIYSRLEQDGYDVPKTFDDFSVKLELKKKGMGSSNKTLQQALKEFYQHYEPNNVPGDQTIDDLAKRYSGREKELWNELYSNYDYQH